MLQIKNLLKTVVGNGKLRSRYVVDREYMRDFQRFLALKGKPRIEIVDRTKTGKVEANNIIDLRKKDHE